MAKIIISDEAEIERYKKFLQYEQEIAEEHKVWKELKDFTKHVNYGSFTLVIKDGLPYRVDNPIQTIIFGVRI